MTGILLASVVPMAPARDPVRVPVDDGLQARAAARLNHHRSLAGLPAVRPHPAVARAALAHARYLARHVPAGHISLEDAHGERPGRVGFTGRGPGERVEVQGLAASVAEGVSSETGPEAAVDHLVNSVYHRSGLFRPEARWIGFGAMTRGVVNLAWTPEDPSPPGIWVYPGEGATGIPPRFPGGELPDPLPGVGYPVGPPLSIGTPGAAPRVRAARLVGPGGAVPLRKLTPSDAPQGDLLGVWTYLVPLEPLQEGTAYRLEAEVRDGDRWRKVGAGFATGSETPGEDLWSVEIRDVRIDGTLARGARVRIAVELVATHEEDLGLRFTEDGATVQDGPGRSFEWQLPGWGRHELGIRAYYRSTDEAFAARTLVVDLGPAP